jgi:hypothetical protein
MDSKTTSTSSSYQNQIKNQLQILNRITAPEDTWGKSPVDKELLFSANDNKSETTAKFHRQLVLAGVEGPVMESILAMHQSPGNLLFQLLVSAPPGSYLVSKLTAELVDTYFKNTGDERLKAKHRAWRGFKPNVAEETPANASEEGDDLVLPSYESESAAEEIPAVTLKLSDTTGAWYDALTAREIPCTPFNILKDCTGCDAAQYKETLRALAQNSPLLNTLPQGTGGRTVGLSAVQIQTSLNGEKTEFRLHSTSFTTLIEALRYLDEFCVKVLKYYLDKSKVDALTACFNHTSRLLQANPISPRLTTKESEHPYVSAITGHTKEHLIALFDSQSGAPNHNLGDASDTASTMTKIWTFSTNNYVGPVKSAQDLAALIDSLPAGEDIDVKAQLEIFTRSFDNKHPFNAIVVDSKLRVAEKVEEEGGSLPTLPTFAKSVESLAIARHLVLEKPPPKSKKSKKSNSSPPETANSTQTGGRGSGRKGGKGTGDGGGGGTGKGEKGGPRRAVNCYYCKSPVARTPSPGECGGPSSCKWRHHFESLQALLIETNGQLPPVSRGHAQRSRCTKGVSSGEVAVSPPPSHSERFGRFLQLRD